MNLNFVDLQGRSLALLLSDSRDGSIYVVNGVVALTEEGHVLDHEDGQVPLLSEWRERVQQVGGEVQNIVGAPFLLTLNVGSLPDDVPPDLLVKTGLRLPTNSELP